MCFCVCVCIPALLPCCSRYSLLAPSHLLCNSFKCCATCAPCFDRLFGLSASGYVFDLLVLCMCQLASELPLPPPPFLLCPSFRNQLWRCYSKETPKSPPAKCCPCADQTHTTLPLMVWSAFACLQPPPSQTLRPSGSPRGHNAQTLTAARENLQVPFVSR